ncbi:MAG: ATP-dependent RecD-like DNA helicase, partial [Flavobacteriaceae bacterium]
MKPMTVPSFLKVLREGFPHNPTVKQQVALEKLADFVLSKERDRVFLMKGYAGTGKTTLVGTLVRSLWKTTMKSVLMAPTGRAAKVMSNYAKTQAFTIHRKIYVPKKQKGGAIQFVLAPNKHRDTIFLVDEASMIPDAPTDSKLFENGSLLDDLMMYVYAGHNCKLILIGDTAQLPPVHLALSPALDPDKLSLNFNKEVEHLELDEVVRQTGDSGIL